MRSNEVKSDEFYTMHQRRNIVFRYFRVGA
jgi:hypothetical protein